jgi:competence ComEA-like helix-hairpin-helix protein
LLRFGLTLLSGCALLVSSSSCVKQTRRLSQAGGQIAPDASLTATADSPLVNINTASRVEFEKLPGIGPVLAARIVEHRERYGRFRRAEHLLLVRGLSERRFRAMSSQIAVE